MIDASGGNSLVATAKPTFGNLRFRHGSSARYDSAFSKEQTWVNVSGKSKQLASYPIQSWYLTLVFTVCSEFVDELPELDEIYSVQGRPTITTDVATPHSSRAAESPAASVAIASVASEDPSFAQSSSWTPRSLHSGTQIKSPTKRRRTNDSDGSSFHSVSQTSGILPYLSRTDSFSGPPLRQEDAIDSLLRAADFSDQGLHSPGNLSSPSQDQVQIYTDPDRDTPRAWPQVSLQEACLMRYFIDELACWVSRGIFPPAL
jgi:hypothetical protein